MFETVIVPLDGSALAEAALPPAMAFAEKFGSKIILLRAVEPTSSHFARQVPAVFESPSSAQANVELIEQVVAAERDEATKYLEATRERVGGSVEYLLVEGAPAQAIADVAQERDAGLIVMSSHGRSGLKRMIFGSVADAVLRDSTVPVLLIRIPEEERNDDDAS